LSTRAAELASEASVDLFFELKKSYAHSSSPSEDSGVEGHVD